jgi:hypothetical protein
MTVGGQTAVRGEEGELIDRRQPMLGRERDGVADSRDEAKAAFRAAGDRS